MKTVATLGVSIMMFAQGHSLAAELIRGKVVDSEGAVISGASIRVLDDTSRSTINALHSDANGRFDVDELGSARYLIVISAPGFSDDWIRTRDAAASANVIQIVRMHALDCDAPTVNCDSFSHTAIPDAHPIISHTQLTVDLNSAVDLEKSRLVRSGSGLADVRLTESGGGLYISPLHGARFTSACGSPSAGDKPDGETLPFRIDGLGPRTEICLMTRGGRYSKVFVTREVNPGDKQIEISVVTRVR